MTLFKFEALNTTSKLQSQGHIDIATYRRTLVRFLQFVKLLYLLNDTGLFRPYLTDHAERTTMKSLQPMYHQNTLDDMDPNGISKFLGKTAWTWTIQKICISYGQKGKSYFN